MQALLEYAAKRLGMSPEQLARTVSDGGYQKLSASLSDESRRKLEQLTGDPQKAEALLSSPAVQAYLKRFHK